MRAVNLLPRDAMRPGSGQGRRLPLVVAVGGIVVATVTSAFLAFSASGTADERRAELALTEAAVAAVPSPEQPGTSTGFVVQERADRIAALSAALSSRVAVDRVLRELSYVLPADAWLTGLIANAPSQTGQTAAPPGGASASPGAAGVTIQGATFSHESVARVLARLSVLPTLENVRLTASARIQPSVNQSADAKQTQRKQKKQKKQRTVVTFTISADLRPGGKS
jgi:Tfp pilus assembly protein PilN